MIAALLRRADAIESMHLRFNAAGTDERTRLAAVQGTDSIRMTITQLCRVLASLDGERSDAPAIEATGNDSADRAPSTREPATAQTVCALTRKYRNREYDFELQFPDDWGCCSRTGRRMTDGRWPWRLQANRNPAGGRASP